MPRLEVNLGQMAQPAVGATRSSFGSFNTGWKPQGAESRPIGFVLAKQPFKRTVCKTCKGDGCVGHCQF